MKLAIIVTEFPKATETFIYRDLMEFRRQGADLRLYHVAPFRADQLDVHVARHISTRYGQRQRSLPALVGLRLRTGL